MHPNAQLIESLYSAIRDNEPNRAAACYSESARYEDIAFRLEGRKSISDMWRLVCSREVKVVFDSIVADDNQGTGHWVFRYTFSETGKQVVNDMHSHFSFRDGLIVDHHDKGDAVSWAKQAYFFPKSFLVGHIGPLRRFGARKKLEEFIQKD